MIIYKRDYLIFGGVVLVLVLYIINISVQIYHQEDGFNSAAIKKRIAQLELENSLLQTQIYDQTSFRIISAKAEALGFRKITQKDYITLKGGGE